MKLNPNPPWQPLATEEAEAPSSLELALGVRDLGVRLPEANVARHLPFQMPKSAGVGMGGPNGAGEAERCRAHLSYALRG